MPAPDWDHIAAVTVSAIGLKLHAGTVGSKSHWVTDRKKQLKVCGKVQKKHDSKASNHVSCPKQEQNEAGNCRSFSSDGISSFSTFGRLWISITDVTKMHLFPCRGLFYEM